MHHVRLNDCYQGFYGTPGVPLYSDYSKLSWTRKIGRTVVTYSFATRILERELIDSLVMHSNCGALFPNFHGIKFIVNL
jgi:hypothetical protein